MSAPPRLVVFTSNLSYSVCKGIADLEALLPGSQWLVLLHKPAKPWRVLLRNQWRNLRLHGWRWVPSLIGEVNRRVHERFSPALCPPPAYNPQGLLAIPGMQMLEVPDIHSPDVVARLNGFHADLGLSLAAPILKRQLFSVPRLGTLNLHKGRLPQFRGMPPAFWELWHDQSEVGCSVHWVDEKLDTGALVVEGTVPRFRFATVKGLQLRLDELGCELMCTAVRDVLAGQSQARPQPSGEGTTHRKPTLAQEAQLRRKLQQAEPSGDGARRVAKQVYSVAAWNSCRVVRRFAMAPRVTVLLYHRVSDDVRDNLTVGVEQFDRQMGLLSRHCEVLGLDEVLAARKVPSSSRPLVAVTFDDGYLDNYLHAAPILRRHGLPAAFFVSTGIVGCDGRFPHDIKRGNPPIPTMSWDHLREMQRWGFSVGSHTVNHIDCAAEPVAVVRDELARSQADLRRELGIERQVLAYPYGGRQHMTPQRLELVREAGYVGCLSAYGGVNVGSVDAFNVLRRGVHWEFSDAAFMLEALGLP